MKIISLKPGRNSRLVWLKFDNSRLLPLLIDDLVTLKVTKTEDISAEKLALFEVHSLKFMLEEYSLRQVAISPKIRQILEPKLKDYCRRLTLKFGYPPSLYFAAINSALEKLTTLNLLDETQYIDYYLRRHAKKSQLQIKFALSRLGLTLPAGLHFSSSDQDNLQKLLLRKYSRLDMTDFHVRQKVMTALARRGFALNDIKTVIDDYLKIR